jgi:hypothetical protein
MRFRLPDGCAGITHDGRSLEVGPDGTIDLDRGAADALVCHGLVPIVPVDEPRRRQAGRPEVRRGPR